MTPTLQTQRQQLARQIDAYLSRLNLGNDSWHETDSLAVLALCERISKPGTTRDEVITATRQFTLAFIGE